MLWRWSVVLGMGWIGTVGCGIAPPAPDPGPRGAEVHWGAIGEPYPVAIGQLDPVSVNRVLGRRGSWLGVGGMIARHDSPLGRVDEVLLYFRTRDPDRPLGPGADHVRLRLGTETFEFRADPRRVMSGASRDGGYRGSHLLVPVPGDFLARLSRARYVEGWIGSDWHFELRPSVLGRLAAVVALVDRSHCVAQRPSSTRRSRGGSNPGLPAVRQH